MVLNVFYAQEDETKTHKQSAVSILEVESSRTFLASRTHFEVLGLGLEASSPQKLPCPRLEDSTIFEPFEISLENARNLAENPQRPFFWFPQVEIA